MKINELMSADPRTCGPDDALLTAAHLMWTENVGVLPVVGPERWVVGMLSDRDIAMALVTKGGDLTRLKVRDVMRTDVHAVLEDDWVAMAEQVMRDNRVRRVPVLDRAGHLVGVLSIDDMARAASGEHKQLSPTGVVETLGAIVEPIKQIPPA